MVGVHILRALAEQADDGGVPGFCSTARRGGRGRDALLHHGEVATRKQEDLHVAAQLPGALEPEHFPVEAARRLEVFRINEDDGPIKLRQAHLGLWR
eukprot:CAMPEP_0177212214 /NCGR_PEP_ID=MMETSP0367-20130122/32515_1 /TAXON_ID=447022 ORGANISM="Scrippsiella hangoei-like, Strain SHHI-4" /NCGR_SAMPLE_ID=MMETSP0367 /ASSEMBLY_ACC=CAM_ASM_000362 /LENGTH=96 /DNA_ID=CAMNT_0018661469 /DNA_START=192 /DNA_END=479 /DNA_ORIENTATION=+